jgi:hypothetical protein
MGQPVQEECYCLTVMYLIDHHLLMDLFLYVSVKEIDGVVYLCSVFPSDEVLPSTYVSFWLTGHYFHPLLIL